MLPAICVRFFGNSRITARKVTLLPEPGSPSSPSPSPSPSEKLRSFTAWTVRSPVKRMLRPLISTRLVMVLLRHPVVEIGGALECRADPQQPGFLERAADQLHADRKAGARKA